MREYKFRGKRIDTGEWVYGYLFETPLTVENFEAGFLGTGKKRVCISDKIGVVFEVDPKSVGQYTGRKEKKGREVYEGDVVRIGSLKDFNCEGVVVYQESAFVVKGGKWTDKQWPCELIEAIGNIHENPELLEGK